jgi:hypothetical protein
MRRFSYAALALFGGTFGVGACGPPSEPVSAATPEVTVDAMPSSTTPDRQPSSPTKGVGLDGDRQCRKLVEGAASHDNSVSVFIRLAGPTCCGPRAVKDGPALRRAAAAAAKAGVERAVLYVDEDVAYGRVVSAMDELRQGGIQRMIFAVQKSE